MPGNLVQISAEAALRETAELAEYFRNRNLILAHQLDATRRELEALKGGVADLPTERALAADVPEGVR